MFEKNKIEKVDLLKLDCEGAEYDILYSLPKEKFKKINRIALEAHKREGKTNNALSLKAFLEENGFVCKTHTNLNIHLSNLYFERGDIKQ